VLQTRLVLERLRADLPGVDFETIEIETPGDADLRSDLRDTPPDFFTRTLDEALLEGRIDLAIHSAKDMPDPVPGGIDWFWMPDAGDRRDVLVGSLEPQVIGVSSDRRTEYARKRFPHAVRKPVRGHIEERLRQIDEGTFDTVIMAGVALQRLGLEERIAEWIPLDKLDSPEAQGVLGVAFRRDDRRIGAIRGLYVKTAAFVGAGVCAGHLTVDGVEALQAADICLYDALMDEDVLKHLPEGARKVYVGKRRGAHSRKQEDINRLLCDCVRKGLRTVRLKGGDPGIFGRLAEEIEALQGLGLASRVIPGISAMQTGAADTGILLTRRGTANGFTVMTPRMKGGGLAPVGKAARAALPVVFYMSVTVSKQVADELIGKGADGETPCALLFGAGTDREFTLRTNLNDLANAFDELDEEVRALPGLFIVGDIASYEFDKLGPLAGKQVLLTCSEALQARAAQAVSDFGGRPVSRPLISLKPLQQAVHAVRDAADYDWIALTSPSSVRCFHQTALDCGMDLRQIPKIMATGPGTARALANVGLGCDLLPEQDFSGEGLLKAIGSRLKGQKVLRLRSAKAGPELAEELRKRGATVKDCVLYENHLVEYEQQARFDAVFFASASAVESFIANWGTTALKDKIILAMGKPTARELAKHDLKPDITPRQSTVEGAIAALAFHCAGRKISDD